MARQTSGQQIPPKGTTRQKISKTSPSKREIHGFLTDRITRFPCQNMKLCKLGVQVGAYLEDRAPNTPKRGDRTGAARPLSRAKVSRGQDLPRAARPLSRAKVSPGGETRPGLPTHFRMRKSPGGKTCPGLPAHFRMRKAPGGQDQSCRLTFACESLPGARPAPGCQTTFACERPPGGKTRAADSLSHVKVSRGQDLPRTARPLSRAKVSRGPRPELPTHFRMRKSPGARPAPDCPPTFACERPPGAKTRAADSLSHAKVSPGGSTSPFLEIGLDQIRDVGIEWNLQFIAQDRHALMDRFWQSQRDCLALRVDPGPSPGRHSPIPPERMGFFLCWRRVRLHAAIEQS